jgi:DNA-binding IclR family transcriptional regulator
MQMQRRLAEVGVHADKRHRRGSSQAKDGPKKHRTIDRVTRILEEVVYKPGMTFSELVKVLDAAKSSVHGFISGLVANGWLYSTDGRFYLGPAVYGLTLASGHIRAGAVTYDDIRKLHEESGFAVVLGVRAGDHLIYIAEAGTDPVIGFDAQTNIRRTLLATAGGKTLLADMPDAQREAFLRRRNTVEADLVSAFLNELRDIRQTRVATNVRHNGTRLAIAAAVHNRSGEPIASITLVGETTQIKPRVNKLSKLLRARIEEMETRSTVKPRGAVLMS